MGPTLHLCDDSRGNAYCIISGLQAVGGVRGCWCGRPCETSCGERRGAPRKCSLLMRCHEAITVMRAMQHEPLHPSLALTCISFTEGTS